MQPATQRHTWTLGLTRRVRFTGRLRMTSALHVGGGVGTSSITDAGVIRHPDGQPFIPGSSLKGVLRSHLERLAQAPALHATGLTSCLLYQSEDYESSAPSCPTPGWIDSGADATKATEDHFAALCHTCTLFGSPILAGKIRVPDLEVIPETYPGGVEIRDGVGIDRDRGRAVDGIKFDYEVIPAGTTFGFEVQADSPDDVELAMLAIAVREMQEGYVQVGGKTTRGLGACVLEDLAVYAVDFSDVKGLESYLLDRVKGQKTSATETGDDANAYLADCIEPLFAS